jgi:hypothetical protein
MRAPHYEKARRAGSAAGLDKSSLLGGFNNREITENSVPAQAPSLRPKYLATRLHAPVRQTLENAAPIDFCKINHAALAALPAVLARVLPSGKRVHREWVALNPRRVDRSLGSFKVNRFNGKWCDFATGDKGSDPVSLVAYVEGVSQSEAARLLARMLGLALEVKRHA